ncbi:MAG: DEAD/DEAH box helicase family protein [Corynebacterium nuruki]|nr:DEAD/DEAH box helicase family protein [Corynebacterium nuruki]
MPLAIAYDEAIIDIVATKFDLRTPNREALDATVRRLADGDYDPQTPLVVNHATGVGKTYVMGALIEYLREMGHCNIMVVTPGLVIQNKTVANFTKSHRKYIGGFDVQPDIITPENQRAWRDARDAGQGSLADTFLGSQIFVFNVQTLLAPKSTTQVTTGETLAAKQAKIRKFDENRGNLYAHLQSLDDLVIFADESHLYGKSAKAFSAALTELDPAATIVLTASATADDDVVYRYPLYRAIADKYVKQPVLVYRKNGYKKNADGDERQLRDGLAVLRQKEAAYRRFIQDNPDVKPVKPVMFVTCSDIDHATAVTTLLRGAGYVADTDAVLQVDSKHDDDATREKLDNLDAPDSPVRAVVAVSKLREGWDVSNVAVIVTLRASSSEILTQQTMGRGLRLPFGKYTGDPAIDQLDIIAHKSYRDYLKSEDVLKDFGLDDALAPDEALEAVDESGIQVTPGSGESTPDDMSAADDSEPTDQDNATVGNDGGWLAADDDDRTETAPQPPTGTGRPAAGTRELGDDDEIAPPPQEPAPVVIRINSKFANESFLFPSSSMSTHIPAFDLADITDDAVTTAAASVVAGSVKLDRHKIVARDNQITTTSLTRVTGGSDPVTDDHVRAELMKAAQGTRRFTVTAGALRLLDRRIVGPFMDAAMDKGAWTEKALTTARESIAKLITKVADEHDIRAARLEIDIEPRKLPIASEFVLPSTATVAGLLRDTPSAQFNTSTYYGNWDRGLFDRARFDSFSAEYELAALVDGDDEVKWWKRLYREDKAHFAWTPRNTYYPDFVVCDTDGELWIVEGKSNRDANNDEVMQKRAAAEKVMRTLTADDRFDTVRWGYLLATESDIAASDSWDELKQRTGFVQS